VRSVDGQPVEHRRGTIKKGHPWLPRLGQVWLYDVSFEPGRETKIQHRYRVAQGEVSDGTALGSYVTRTGATWAGTIGHARFRIHVPVETRSLSVDPEGKYGGGAEALAAIGLSLTTHVVGSGTEKTGELLLEAHDWEPKTDLTFSFFAKPGANTMPAYELLESNPNKQKPIAERCPNIIAIWQVGLARAEPNPGDHIPPSDPTEEDVERFVREGLGSGRICSAFVHATYGKRFEDDALNRYFYGWQGWRDGGWPYGPMQPNPGYSEAMLTPGDRAALQLIERVEARLTCKAATGKGGAGVPASPGTGAAVSPSAPARAPAAATRGCGCHVLGRGRPNATTGAFGLVGTLGFFLLVGLAARRRPARLGPLRLG
jgi:hypothetical protein